MSLAGIQKGEKLSNKSKNQISISVKFNMILYQILYLRLVLAFLYWFNTYLLRVLSKNIFFQIENYEEFVSLSQLTYNNYYTSDNQGQ